MQFDLQELVRLIRAAVVRAPGRAAVRPSHDLDRIGPDTLLFPMPQVWVGDSLFRLLRARGAAGVVLGPGQPVPDATLYPELGVLRTESPVNEFVRLGEVARLDTTGAVVGITGTSGKSSACEFMASVLRTAHTVHATRDSRNLLWDCAGTLLNAAGDGAAAIIEMGFGRTGDIAQMADLARPHAGILTNVTPAHLDGAGWSWEEVAREKARLGSYIVADGVFAVHAEDPGCQVAREGSYRAKVYTFGATSRADVRYSDVQADELGVRFSLSLFGQPLSCRIRGFAPYQAANAAAVALVAHTLGIPYPDIAQGLSEAPALYRRFEVHRLTRGLTVVDDTFNASIRAMEEGLKHAAYLAGHRKLVAVLSDVALLGPSSQDYHRSIGRLTARLRAAALILLADGWTAGLREGALEGGMNPGAIHEVATRDGLPDMLMQFAQPDTLIFCKTRQAYWAGIAVDAFLKRLAAGGFERI